ncbi:hypothetical protein LIER_44105 [Lithospermum erythrorhizon]|uniref:Pleiotropic ABC efflux transporter N-terminal domain-containing protein n=1 Tax=Lithospermum erythrorhizon TaxID=34254 RepID=A0AAV3PPS2_LITER
METNLRAGEEYNERFLRRLRERFDRVEVDIPKVEVRFEHLSIEGDAYLGTRALPTLPNSVLNVIEVASLTFRLHYCKLPIDFRD